MNNKLFRWFLGLFDNSPDGASMRKVVTVWIMILVNRIHNKYLNFQVSSEKGDFTFAQTLVYVDYLMIGLLLGMIVFQDIMKLKMFGREDSKPDQPKEEEKRPEN